MLEVINRECGEHKNVVKFNNWVEPETFSVILWISSKKFNSQQCEAIWLKFFSIQPPSPKTLEIPRVKFFSFTISHAYHHTQHESLSPTSNPKYEKSQFSNDKFFLFFSLFNEKEFFPLNFSSFWLFSFQFICPGLSVTFSSLLSRPRKEKLHKRRKFSIHQFEKAKGEIFQKEKSSEKGEKLVPVVEGKRENSSSCHSYQWIYKL